VLKENTREHIILIISLYKHGVEVFGDFQNFFADLQKYNSGNRFFDNVLL